MKMRRVSLKDGRMLVYVERIKKRNSVRYKEQDYGREKIQYESELINWRKACRGQMRISWMLPMPL